MYQCAPCGSLYSSVQHSPLMFCPQHNKLHQRIEKQVSLWKLQANELEMWAEAAACFFYRNRFFYIQWPKQYGRIQPNRMMVNIARICLGKKCYIYSSFGKLLHFATCRNGKRTFFRDKCLSFFSSSDFWFHLVQDQRNLAKIWKIWLQENNK